jgi:hypothetical protein
MPINGKTTCQPRRLSGQKSKLVRAKKKRLGYFVFVFVFVSKTYHPQHTPSPRSSPRSTKEKLFFRSGVRAFFWSIFSRCTKSTVDSCIIRSVFSGADRPSMHEPWRSKSRSDVTTVAILPILAACASISSKNRRRRSHIIGYSHSPNCPFCPVLLHIFGRFFGTSTKLSPNLPSIFLNNRRNVVTFRHHFSMSSIGSTLKNQCKQNQPFNNKRVHQLQITYRKQPR